MPLPAASRHPHLDAPRPPDFVRVDMHMHTMWSGDATTTPEELVEAVAESGIDVLCITDHGTINGAVELGDRLGCRVVVGQELRTGPGEIIGLFLTERLPAGIKPEEAVARIRDQGGVVYIPHPFDPMRHCLKEEVLLSLIEAGSVDALEGFNAKTSLSHLNARAVSLATEAGLPVGAGSDAHEPSAIGAAYVEMPAFTDSSSFLSSLRLGSLIGHHYDRPRVWRSRIVPSTKAT